MRERVAVIGGGVSGTLSAVRLAEAGFAVLLLEKAAIGNGSSSRSMAGIRAQFGVEETIVGMLYAEWFYRHFHELLATPAGLLATPADRRDPVLRQNGYLFLYDREPRHRWQAAQSRAEVQRCLGAPVELLDAETIRRRWPHLVCDQLIGATWSPADGFLYPAVIYAAAARRAEELGAQIWQRTEVLGAQHAGGRITRLETTRGAIEVDWVVNCTNAWAPRTSARLGGMPLPIEPSKRFLYHLAPEPPRPEWSELPMTIYGTGRVLGTHSRPHGAQLILAGAEPIAPDPDFSDEDQDQVPAAFDHRHGIENFGFTLLADLARYAPELATSGGLVATTCGYYGMTPDGVPLIGRDAQVSNLVHAAGFAGHGIMHAPVTALLVAAVLEGATEQVPLPPPFAQHHLALSRFAPDRDFSRVPVESAVL